MKYLERLAQPKMRKHIIIISIGFVLGILLFVYLSSSLETHISSHFLSKSLLTGVLGVSIAYLISYISKKLDASIPWGSQLVSRFIAGIGLLSFVCLFLVYSFLYVYSSIIGLPNFDNNYGLLTKLAIIVFSAILLYNIIYFSIYSFHSYSKLQITTVAYERKQLDLQLNALKTQLSPHFLFNNLNTISALIHQDVKSAETFIRGMAKIYNYTLAYYDLKLIPLNKEMEVVKAYSNLLKIRYGNSIHFKFTIEDNAKLIKIPPLSLQMLMENAVKHNNLNQKNPLIIKIYSTEDSIVVSNNIIAKKENLSSLNIGLKNIDNRYKLLGKKGIEIKEDSQFVVGLPIIYG